MSTPEYTNLILSRRAGEAIVIGEGDNQVVVRVISVGGGRAHIGLEADPSVPIRRQELEEPPPPREMS